MNIKTNYLEIVVFILFCIAVTIISCFHEPWFDELQAWGISKDSLYNILFVIPHIEGHPPLWHLILKCFSHFNVNCEPGIRIPNLLFMFSAVWLIIFKSPFPRAVKLLLPFTYFMFYQYSVISRPYSIFCFAIFLAAVFYKERNEHPFRFVSALALLCLSCAYGMVISTGIILVWFVELTVGGGYNTKKKLEFVMDLIRDKRFYSMFAIFLLCLILCFMMYPDKAVLYNSDTSVLSSWKKFLYAFFVLPADALCTNISGYSYANILNNSGIFCFGCLLGALINILFIFVLKKYKKLLLFYLPFLLFSSAVITLYIGVHHIGLLTCFYVFIFWCAIEEENLQQNKIFTCFIFITLAVQIYWSICACIHEIKYPYSSSRNISKFIKQNNLQNYKIMAQWLDRTIYKNKKTNKIIKGKPVLNENQYKYFYENYEKIENINIHGQNICVIINPYFNRNIFYSFNTDKPEREYVVFKKMTEKEAEDTKQTVRKEGLPDLILNQARLYEIFDAKELDGINYILLKQFNNYKIWKKELIQEHHEIYIKNDLYNKLTEKITNNKE